MQFASDNWTGIAPEILDAISRENTGSAPSYGGDALTVRVQQKFNELFERDCAVYFVATGGAANGLALSVLTPPYGAIFCHEESHIQMDECAGPEFFTGGAKLIPVSGEAAKFSAKSLQNSIEGYPHRPPHGSPLTTVSLTQATECGTVYAPEEIKAICNVARQHNMKVHMDGARFANAAASLGLSPAEMTWKAGVDVLSFGGTKNGCLAAEAVVFFDPADVRDFEFRRKRAGHLWSKMRFIAAQFDAYLTDDLWLNLAAKANAKAAKLSEALAGIGGVDLAYETEINEVFVRLSDETAKKLRDGGAAFYPWVTPGSGPEQKIHRLITAFNTDDASIDGFVAAVKKG